MLGKVCRKSCLGCRLPLKGTVKEPLDAVPVTNDEMEYVLLHASLDRYLRVMW